MSLPKPCGERVLVKLGETPNPRDSQARIILPEGVEKRWIRFGEVVAAGPRAAKDLRPGVRVLAYHTVGTPWTDGEDDYVLITAEHIAGIVK